MRQQDPIAIMLDDNTMLLSVTNNTNRDSLIEVLEYVKDFELSLYITHTMDDEMTEWFNSVISVDINVYESYETTQLINSTINEVYFDCIRYDIIDIINSGTVEETTELAYSAILANEEILQTFGLVFDNYSQENIIDEFLTFEICEECLTSELSDETTISKIEEELSNVLLYAYEKFDELLDYKDDTQTRLQQALVSNIYHALNDNF